METGIKPPAEDIMELGLECIRKPKNRVAVVFIHGILSGGETAWKSDSGNEWPDMLCKESELTDVGCYVYSYETNIWSAGYSIGDVVDDLKEQLELAEILGSKKSNCRAVIFVCHSMGGIIVRRYLVREERHVSPKRVRIGLFLIASPSRGSSYANCIARLAARVGHSQAETLKTIGKNTWLSELDKDFKDLLYDVKKRVDIRGRELIESHMIQFSISKTSSPLKRLLQWVGNILLFFISNNERWLIVNSADGAVYFSRPYKVPQSDHFTIAKPISRRSMQHQLLLKFLVDSCEGLGKSIVIRLSGPLRKSISVIENANIIRKPPGPRSTTLPAWALVLIVCSALVTSCGYFAFNHLASLPGSMSQMPSHHATDPDTPGTDTDGLPVRDQIATFVSTPSNVNSDAMEKPNYYHTVLITLPRDFALNETSTVTVVSPPDSKLIVTSAVGEFQSDHQHPNVAKGHITSESGRDSTGVRRIQLEVTMRNVGSSYILQTERALGGSHLSIQIDGKSVQFAKSGVR